MKMCIYKKEPPVTTILYILILMHSLYITINVYDLYTKDSHTVQRMYSSTTDPEQGRRQRYGRYGHGRTGF